jgi:predicted nucleic acid-binding protein
VIFFDTSVLIAASSPHHASHEACVDRLAAADVRGGACAAHSLAEMYSVFTRIPPPFRIPPAAALQIAQHTSKRFTVVTLTTAEQLAVIRDLADRELGGGMTYDALIAACARKARATRLYTLNRKHFCKVAPDLTPRIFEP